MLHPGHSRPGYDLQRNGVWYVGYDNGRDSYSFDRRWFSRQHPIDALHSFIWGNLHGNSCHAKRRFGKRSRHLSAGRSAKQQPRWKRNKFDNSHQSSIEHVNWLCTVAGAGGLGHFVHSKRGRLRNARWHGDVHAGHRDCDHLSHDFSILYSFFWNMPSYSLHYWRRWGKHRSDIFGRCKQRRNYSGNGADSRAHNEHY